MAALDFSLDTTLSEFEDIFFNRPVSRLHASKIGIISSRSTPIKSLNSLYQIINSLGHDPCLVTDEKQSLGIIPADVVLKNKKNLGYSNVDDAIAELSGCKVVVFLSTKELNSAMELFMEKLLTSYKGLLITNRSSLVNKTTTSAQVIIIEDTQKIKAKYDSGLNHVANLVISYSSDIGRPIIYYSAKRIICADSNIPDKVAVINYEKGFAIEEFIGFLASLIANKKIPLEADWLRYCQASGYLMRLMLDNDISSVKIYLNEKF